MFKNFYIKILYNILYFWNSFSLLYIVCYNLLDICVSTTMRKFEIVDFPSNGKNYGSYSANVPSQAASKAFTALTKKMGYDKDDAEKFIVFSIREKKGGGGKVYEYVGTKVKLHKPIHIGKRTYNYRNIVVSHKDKYFD